MAVTRIVAKIFTGQVGSAATFYRDVLGMSVVMDLGSIVTFDSNADTVPQIGVATPGANVFRAARAE